MERLLTRRELAAQMGVHPNTVDRLRKRGMPCRMIGSSPRFKPSEVERWLDTYSPSGPQHAGDSA